VVVQIVDIYGVLVLKPKCYPPIARDRNRVMSFQAALERVLLDDAERSRILAAATDTLARYSWQSCGAQLLDVLQACARR